MRLTVIGTGVYDGDISVNALEALKSAKKIVLRTENTISAQFIKRNGFDFITLDYVYEKSRNFDTLIKNICKEISDMLKDSDVCYVVDGAVSEDVCAGLLIKKCKDVRIYEGVSKVGYALAMAGVENRGYTAVSAYCLDGFENFSLPLVVYDLDNPMLASEWKLRLFSLIGEEQKVHVYIDGRMFYLPMYEIDTLYSYDYSTVLIVDEKPLVEKERYDFNDLLKILKVLRSENGCPWDKVQTPETIIKDLIEETYELIDAINQKDDDKILEETGDLLLQAAFYITFAEESGVYDRTDVLYGICYKLISRHSHVFGTDNAQNVDQALGVWDKNKQVEKGYESVYGYLNDVPHNFPAALRSGKVLKRALSRDIDFGSVEDSAKVIDKIAQKASDGQKLAEADLENLLFACVNLVKRDGGDPEILLMNATERFIGSVKALESYATARGKNLSDLTLGEVESYLASFKN